MLILHDQFSMHSKLLQYFEASVYLIPSTMPQLLIRPQCLYALCSGMISQLHDFRLVLIIYIKAPISLVCYHRSVTVFNPNSLLLISLQCRMLLPSMLSTVQCCPIFIGLILQAIETILWVLYSLILPDVPPTKTLHSFLSRCCSPSK